MSIRLRRRLPLVALIIVVGALLWAVGASSPTEAQQPTADSSQLLSQLNSEGALVHRHQETGEVRFIGASKDNPIDRPAGLAENASPEAAARAHLAELGELFGIQNQASELRAEGSTESDGGRASTHFQQVHEDVPVLGGELNVQVDDANNLLVATGEVLPEISIDTEPGVEAKEAQEAALEKIAKDRELEVGGLQATEPELWIYVPSLLGGPGPDLTRLVWRMEVTPAEGIVDFRELVLVDAQSGAVVLNFDQIDNARNRNTHTANNGTTLPGTLVCDESNTTCSGGDADAVAAHRYAGETYDFYSANHGRDSLDNLGMTLISTVHYGSGFANAFWNGQQMVYGDGYPVDDVVGHELTHGVTDHESHLFYYYQSGAINESLPDVWGEFIDLSNATEPADTRWLIGEDIPGIGALRDMEDPPTFSDPDRMLSSLYANVQPDNSSAWDQGGVHTNSGVNNKAAYLMTDGGTFNGTTVTGLGITKVAKIYYEAQANLLTSGSDYQDLHSNLRQACTNLIGTSGITSVDCAEVKDAVDATEMNLIPPAAQNPEAPVCPTGQTATDLFNDNLENPASGNWTKTGSWFYPQNPNGIMDAIYATSGTTNIWGYNQGSTGDYAIARTANVTPPTGKTTYLRFSHSYQFDDTNNSTFWDGGVLEYSTDNGLTWKDAGSLITDNGYDGTISTLATNPLGGRQGFAAESNGYISSRVNLSSLAGQNVRFRFRIGTDSFVDDFGWFIDDVRVYTCESGVTTPPNDAFASSQTLTGANATATGTNVNATKEAGEPNHASNAGGKSVWYKWTPQASGTTTINTAGSNFDTLLAVYTGGAVNSLSQVEKNDDENNAGGVITSKLSFAATAGTTYRIAVDGYNLNGAGAEAGNITLNLASATTNLQTVQENDRDHTSYGNWAVYKDTNFSGGYSSYANATGSATTFKFTGTNVSWKTQKLSDGGITDVYLDGTKVATFDGYSATPQYNVTGYTKSGLASATHTLKLV